MEIYTGLGRDETGSKFKYGYLQIEQEARENPAHPKHEETVLELERLATSGQDHFRLIGSVAVLAATTEFGTENQLYSNEHLQHIPHISER